MSFLPTKHKDLSHSQAGVYLNLAGIRNIRRHAQLYYTLANHNNPPNHVDTKASLSFMLERTRK